ncbi:hypothetical protein FA95DRAFT_1684580 [Auriscalpium vulgare]|uniref:Uncharacterized protein n=1 Tax=Auriscalpium vulgare TaxID=40419 RepID=A0ACB8R3R4_9AGAM|nr:hypothetical protein FA95DRAFT_1684580 [Auriscalpium vulgare]
MLTSRETTPQVSAGRRVGLDARAANSVRVALPVKLKTEQDVELLSCERDMRERIAGTDGHAESLRSSGLVWLPPDERHVPTVRAPLTAGEIEDVEN